jgi:hypothetical protein
MLNILIVILFVSAFVSAQAPAQADTWKPFRFFVGVWQGTGKGEAGDATVEREYKFAVGGKYLQAAHRSLYDPKAKNPKGDVHEDLGFFSYDKGRKQFVFRQFNNEDFLIQFVVSSISEDGKTMILDSESVENIPKTMRARVTYKIVGNNEFTETYEIAEPGKDFAVYYAKDFKRKKQ